MIKPTFLLLIMAMSALSGQDAPTNPPSPGVGPQPQPTQPNKPAAQTISQSPAENEQQRKASHTDSSAGLPQVSSASSPLKAELKTNAPVVTPTVAPEGKPPGFVRKLMSFFGGSRVVTGLPWCIAIFMAVLAGAAGAWVMVLTKQDRHFVALRKKVIDGTEAVYLLPDEATRMIYEFKESLTNIAHSFEESVKAQREEVKRVVHEAESSSQASREETLRTVDIFKTSLNGMLGSLTKFMEKVVQDTSNTHTQALETKEYAKNVAELIDAKEKEITRLKKGYDLHLIAPLTKAFMQIRDDLHAMRPFVSDEQIQGQLADLDQKIVAALDDLQIKEILIPENPQELHPHHWESLGAAEMTDDLERHGLRARVTRKGYMLNVPNGEHHIIRKAVVVVYSYQAQNESAEQHNTNDSSNEADNNMNASYSAEQPTN